jgi:hypothetical protein
MSPCKPSLKTAAAATPVYLIITACQAHRDGGACGCAGSNSGAGAVVDVADGWLRLGVVPGLHRRDVLRSVRQPQLCIRGLQAQAAAELHPGYTVRFSTLQPRSKTSHYRNPQHLPGRQRPAPGGEALLRDQLEQLCGARRLFPVACSRRTHVMPCSWQWASTPLVTW